ncbi:MAG: aspartate carbamoyltransferase catalytic subunit [Chloroflexi bacterium]|nr:aspartate carbamoyltransferase catalytic subunit [Chloroflexota bacterium]
MTATEHRPAANLEQARADRVTPVWKGRRHILDLDDWSPGEIAQVMDTALTMKSILARPIKKTPTLRGKTIVTAFYESSTRTRISFEVAAKYLGADAVNMTASASSVSKGESLLDTVRTLQAIGADIVVMRHPQSGAPWVVSERVNSSIVNGGDGWHAHPTQALLDLFTIRERLGRVAGLKVTILGDVLHSRVARSDIWGLSLLGADVTVCGPPTLLPRDWVTDPGGLPWKLRVEERIEPALEGADVVMALRLQRERMHAGLIPSIREYCRLYALNADRLKLAKTDALVMHPGPMNEGVEISPDVAHGAQSVIEEQVTNGVAIRMALLYLLSGGTARPDGE